MTVTLEIPELVMTRLHLVAETPTMSDQLDDGEYPDFGGNMDDAFYSGIEEGGINMARYILNQANIPYEVEL